jgi:hypothetical protein
VAVGIVLAELAEVIVAGVAVAASVEEVLFVVVVDESAGTRKRSGLNVSGSGYTSGSCRVAQAFPKTMVPLGIRQPRYSSSWVVIWGTAG